MEMGITIMTRDQIESKINRLKILRSEVIRQIKYNEFTFEHGYQSTHSYELAIFHWRSKLKVLDEKINELVNELENGYEF